MVDANRAFHVPAAEAQVLVPDGRAHVDLFDRRGAQRTAGAVGHAEQAVAEDARHRVDVDERHAVAAAAAVVDLYALGGADALTLAASAARLQKLPLRQRAGRAVPVLLGRDRR